MPPALARRARRARSALRAAVVATILAAGASRAAAAQDEGPNWVTHGPILGRLSSSGVGVWARTARSGAFVVRYGLSPDALDRVTAPVATALERDNTAWIELDGLEPGRDRWIAFPRPQAIFQYHDGRTGELLYAEAVLAR